MVARDRVGEILDLKGRQQERGLLITRLEHLRRSWIEHRTDAQTSDFVPIRIVTLIEVFTRAWLAELIDHGSPFVENAASLAKTLSLKFDFAVSMAIQGRTISLGDLVAHSVSTNRIDDIAYNFSTFMGPDL